MSIAPGYGNTAELQRQVAALQARIAELEADNERLRGAFDDADEKASVHWYGEWVEWKRRAEAAQAERDVMEAERDRMAIEGGNLAKRLDELEARNAASERDAGEWGHLVKGEARLLAFFQSGDDPFVYAVDGMLTLPDFAEIEAMIRSEPEAYFERGDGEYSFIARYDAGERNEYGRFFHPAGWDLEPVAFTSTDIDAHAQGQAGEGKNG